MFNIIDKCVFHTLEEATPVQGVLLVAGVREEDTIAHHYVTYEGGDWISQEDGRVYEEEDVVSWSYTDIEYRITVTTLFTEYPDIVFDDFYDDEFELNEDLNFLYKPSVCGNSNFDIRVQAVRS